MKLAPESRELPITRLRHLLGNITQTELARRMKVSQAAVWGWEQGKEPSQQHYNGMVEELARDIVAPLARDRAKGRRASVQQLRRLAAYAKGEGLRLKLPANYATMSLRDLAEDLWQSHGRQAMVFASLLLTLGTGREIALPRRDWIRTFGFPLRLLRGVPIERTENGEPWYRALDLGVAIDAFLRGQSYRDRVGESALKDITRQAGEERLWVELRIRLPWWKSAVGLSYTSEETAQLLKLERQVSKRQKEGGMKKKKKGKRRSRLADELERGPREAAISKATGGAPVMSPLQELVEDPAKFVNEHLSKEVQIDLAKHLLADERIWQAMQGEIARLKNL